MLIGTWRGKLVKCLSDGATCEWWCADMSKNRWKTIGPPRLAADYCTRRTRAPRDRVDISMRTQMSECSSELRLTRTVENLAWIKRVILHPNHSVTHKRSLFVVLEVLVLHERSQRANGAQRAQPSVPRQPKQRSGQHEAHASLIDAFDQVAAG